MNHRPAYGVCRRPLVLSSLEGLPDVTLVTPETGCRALEGAGGAGSRSVSSITQDLAESQGQYLDLQE